MKVLFVSATPTHPTSAGDRARVSNLSEAVARLGHEVHFAYLCRPGVRVAPAMAQRFGERLHVLAHRPRRTPRWAFEHLRRRLQQRAGTEAGFRWSLDAWYDTRVTPRLAALQAAHGFDVVFVEYVYHSRALEAFGTGVRRVIDTLDRFSDRHRRHAVPGEAYAWFALSPEDEERGLARADVVVAIQADEAQAFAALLRGRVAVETVGHVFDPQLTVARGVSDSAILVASSNPSNVDAAGYFVGEVLPRILREAPGFTLFVAGELCERIADARGVAKLGLVGDLPAAYRRAALAVNPVRTGTGLPIKSLETLAFGVPLVTTRSGARGLERWAERAFEMVADDDAEGMARAVLRVLRDRAHGERLASAGRAAALELNEAQLAALARVLGA